MRKMKLLTSVAVAMLAVAALGASGAGAASFTSQSAPTTVSGSQVTKNVLTSDTGLFECLTVQIEGTMPNKSASSIVLAPTYSGCTAFSISATMTVNGCAFQVFAAGSAAFICPAGKDLLIDTAFNSCNVTIQEQTGLSNVSYTNGTSGGKGDITIDWDITNIKYTESGFACAASGKATTGGRLSGSVTMAGREGEGNPTGISWDA